MLAAVSFVLFGGLFAWKRGLNVWKSVTCLTIGVISISIGARLMHWVTSPGSFEHGLPDVLSLSRTNLSGYAGLILSAASVAIVCRLLKMPAWKLADAATPALALSACLAKIGCFLNGCCYGTPTHLPWGIALASNEKNFSQVLSGDIGLFDDPLPVHPTQIYEVVAALSGGVLALIALKLRLPNGVVFLVFAIWFTSCRWVIYPLLQSTGLGANLDWFYPTLYGTVILVALSLLVMKLWRRDQSTMD